MVLKNKYAVKTDTIRNRILLHSEIDTGDANTRYLAEVGIQQVIQSVLNSNGFYSVANGFFVSLNECENIALLKIMLKNANRREESATGTKDKVETIMFRQTKFDGIELDLVEEPSIADIVADLEAHAI